MSFEKEVLGFYVSGHPLEEYEELWRKHITYTTADFMLDEETGQMTVEDGKSAVVGGLIADKKIKYTKNDKVMAFLQLEDLAGSIEVIVFPRDYEKNAAALVEDNKVFVKGRVSAEEDKDGKLICEQITSFDQIPRKLWIKFATMEDYQAGSEKLDEILGDSEGNDNVVIYVEASKAMPQLPPNQNVRASEELVQRLIEAFGEGNVKVCVKRF